MQIYLAAPLFSEAEKNFNLAIAQLIRGNCKNIEVFLPQTIEYQNSQQYFEDRKKGVSSSNIVVAVMDGADADSGTCWECGYAYALGKPIILLRTDFRNSGDSGGFNAMLLGCSVKVVSGIDWKDELIQILNQLTHILTNAK
jgi:nucleoside 2-deoxyribosyltransferase